MYGHTYARTRARDVRRTEERKGGTGSVGVSSSILGVDYQSLFLGEIG
jgi:hypothetical protein